MDYGWVYTRWPTLAFPIGAGLFQRVIVMLKIIIHLYLVRPSERKVLNEIVNKLYKVYWTVFTRMFVPGCDHASVARDNYVLLFLFMLCMKRHMKRNFFSCCVLFLFMFSFHVSFHIFFSCCGKWCEWMVSCKCWIKTGLCDVSMVV